MAFLALTGGAVTHVSGQASFVLRGVRFLGRTALPDTELVSAFGVPAGARTDRVMVGKGLQRVLERYRAEGFLRAGIDSTMMAWSADSLTAELTVVVAEGLPAIVRTISWSGAAGLNADAIAAATDLRTGSRFSTAALESDIASVLHAEEREGRMFATATVGAVRLIPSAVAESADVVVNVMEGRQVRIEEFSVQGNRSTRPAVILREARPYAGELYRPDVGERIRRRLLRLRLFSEVSEPELYLSETDKAGVLLRVAEGPSNSFDGVVGYVPGTRTGESGTVTGLVDVQFRNLFGSGRALAVRWYRETSSSQEVEFRYREPWVAGEPLNAEFGLGLRQQDSTYVRQRIGIAVDALVTDAFTAGVAVSQTNVYPTAGYGKKVMAENSALSFGADLRYDTRDDPVTPTTGGVYGTTYAYGSKRTLSFGTTPGTRFTTQRVTLDVGAYVSVFARQVVAAEAHIRDVQTPDPDPSDLERIGGASTLRGYREGQFTGTRLVWTNLEYRVLVARRSYVYAFTDLASITMPSAPALGWTASQQTKAGFGGGLRIDSQVGLIGVSLGFGQGDTFSTAKLHLRLINEF